MQRVYVKRKTQTGSARGTKVENKPSSSLNKPEIPNTQTVGRCGKQRPEMLTV